MEPRGARAEAERVGKATEDLAMKLAVLDRGDLYQRGREERVARGKAGASSCALGAS